MRRVIATTLCTALCLLACAGCSQAEDEKLVDKESEKLVAVTESDFAVQVDEKSITGTYGNEDYTMTVQRSDDGLFSFTVKSEITDGQSFEWKMTGYLGKGHINYSDAEKSAVTYDKNGTEKSRDTKYTSGGGRIEFTDDGSIIWEDFMETTKGSRSFSKQG